MSHRPDHPKLVLDEGHRHMKEVAEMSRKVERIRSVPGVPNRVYIIDGDKMFLFSVLEQLVKDAKIDLADPSTEIDAQILAVEPGAWVSVHEGVVSHKVDPYPYKIERHDDGVWRIEHIPFRSLIPQDYASEREAREALVGLMYEPIPAAEGKVIDFEYKGQGYTNRPACRLADLPPCPDLSSMMDLNRARTIRLPTIAPFEEGFVSQVEYSEVTTAYSNWRDVSSTIPSGIKALHEQCWKLAPAVTFERAEVAILAEDHFADDVADAMKSLDRLRELYPEMGSMSDKGLCLAFQSYVQNGLFNAEKLTVRHSGFLFYLIGLGCPNSDNPYSRESYGLIYMANFLLSKDDEEALRFYAQWRAYDKTLDRAFYRLNSVMAFLRRAEDGPIRKGPPVSTVMDMFRDGRKHAVSTV